MNIVSWGYLALVSTLVVGCVSELEPAPPGPRIEGIMPVDGGPVLVVELTEQRILYVCSVDPDRPGDCVAVSATFDGLPVVLPPRVVSHFDGRSPYPVVPEGRSWATRFGCPRFFEGQELTGSIEIRVQLVEDSTAVTQSLSSAIVPMAEAFGMDGGILGADAPYLDVQCQGNGVGTERQATHVLHLAPETGEISAYREPLSGGESSGSVNDTISDN